MLNPLWFSFSKDFWGKDIRKEGSGNIGATNVTRVLGKKLGYVVFFLDFIKGIVSIIIAKLYFSSEFETSYNLLPLIAVIGHIFPVWLKFKGGKGVATFIGILAYQDLLFVILIALGWYLVFYITRIVAMASVISMVVTAAFFTLKLKLFYVSIIVSALLIVYKHKENIKRILRGSENKF